MTGYTNESVNLPSAVEEAIEAAANLVGEIPAAVIAETPAHLPAVEGSHKLLVKVLTSLIAHVVRNTKRGQVWVQAGLLPVGETDVGMLPEDLIPSDLEERGMWAKVTISDVQVPGSLSPFQIDVESSTIVDLEEPEVDSLTLADCKMGLQQLGGYLWAEGQPEVGFRFHLVLPLQAAGAVSADVSSLRRAVDTRLLEEMQLAKTLLLLVQDANMQNLLTKELSGAGYRVIVTPNGREVLPLAREEQPDLILLDLLARDPMALDVANVLKHDRQTQGIPVLFLTSVDDPQVGVRMGTVDFVVRSVGTGALLATISAVLRSGISPTARVLVVEPDETLRENMVMLIQAHGYRVTVASTPEEAQALAERVEPGLVLINAELAQDRDYWLLRNLRRISEESEIFVLADALSPEEVRAAIRRGASGYSETGKLPDLLTRVREQQNNE